MLFEVTLFGDSLGDTLGDTAGDTSDTSDIAETGASGNSVDHVAAMFAIHSQAG